MSTPQGWRFQWPDGSWIRWNPETEAWEKEAPGEDASAEGPALPEAPTRATAEPEEREDAQERDEPGPSDPPSEAEDDEVAPEASALRRSTSNVISGSPEADPPRRSYWPTIVGGAVVGLGMGLLLSYLLR